jgi:hypothetical protein
MQMENEANSSLHFPFEFSRVDIFPNKKLELYFSLFVLKVQLPKFNYRRNNMNKPKFIFAVNLFLLILSMSFFTAFAQESKASEPNYEIILHTLIASDNANSQSKIPANLSNVVKKLKETFPFADYQLASTYLERIENKGSFEYKSITDEFADESISPPSFNDWSLRGMKKSSDSSKNMIAFDLFRFGTRIPVIMNGKIDETGKTAPIVNYEAIGFTINNFSLSENKPTLLGTLNLPNKNQMAFVIMTIREVE